MNEAGLILASSNVHVCTVSMFNIKVLEFYNNKEFVNSVIKYTDVNL